MLDTQMSFFDEGEAPEDGHKENLGDPLIESEDEVFALARGILPSLKDAEEEHLPPMLKAARRRRLEKAEALGLVAKWADYKKAKGHISIHDPGSGEWADLPYKAAPSWAQRGLRLHRSRDACHLGRRPSPKRGGHRRGVRAAR